jgi:signal transduction histidine kinase/ActR/RegA family two-component response regulator
MTIHAPAHSTQCCSLPATSTTPESLHRVLAAATDGFWDWELATNKVWYSPRMADILRAAGGTPAPPTPDAWLDRVHPQDRPLLQEAIDTALRAATSIDIQYRLLTADGDFAWVRTRGATYRDSAGMATHLAGSLQNIHHHRTAADQLRQQRRIAIQQQRRAALHRLSAGIAHQFNNRLQVIQGYTSFAYDDAPPDSELRNDLHAALAAIEQAADLTQKLALFGRHDDIEAHDTDLNDTVQQTGEVIGPLVGAEIALECRPSPVPLPISVNTLAIQQAIINLCLNARDAMPQGGQLLISADHACLSELAAAQHVDARPGHYARLSITDNGTGIAADALDRVFDPFFTTKTMNGGAGLGLPTVQHLVQQAHGFVTLYSRLGVGTTVRIFLPLRRTDYAKPVISTSRSDAQQRYCGKTVLLAEDDDQVRDVGRRILSRAGYHVIAVADGQAALESFLHLENEISCLVVDAVMPGLGGRALFEHVRKLGSQVPVVFCTGYDARSTTCSDLLTLGVPVLEKPFSSDTLLAAMETALRKDQ